MNSAMVMPGRAVTATVAEDLLWLALADRTGEPLVDGVDLDLALAGALLVELSVPGVLPRVTPDRDALRAAAADALARPQPLHRTVGDLAGGARAPLLERLHRHGRVDMRSRRLLGVLPRTDWPTRDAAGKAALRADLAAVVLDARHPDPRTLALVCLLDSVRLLAPQFPGWPSATIADRARRIARSDPRCAALVAAIRDAVCHAHAANFAHRFGFA